MTLEIPCVPRSMFQAFLFQFYGVIVRPPVRFLFDLALILL
jgi:hypothetical protein